ncbi:hypothetical protein N782_11965 [Pontibacillus yanchengensis Y32]|uniref:Uncharacterized protein n=1 Tax=Pontibacillus yanchengensis Y32 TaxID=1385514 RepID=A0A0A2TDA6_9BACI|nr:hypothetical protein N782_11965 [Pontibacillus yanchengensis Y32]
MFYHLEYESISLKRSPLNPNKKEIPSLIRTPKHGVDSMGIYETPAEKRSSEDPAERRSRTRRLHRLSAESE